MNHEERVEAKMFHGCAFVVITFSYFLSVTCSEDSYQHETMKIVLTLSEILSYNRKEFFPTPCILALTLIKAVLVLHHADVH